MTDEQTFPAGTIAECNRCKRFSPLLKPCLGHLEAPASEFVPSVYRLDTMCVLDCDHMDAHWVLVAHVRQAWLRRNPITLECGRRPEKETNP